MQNNNDFLYNLLDIGTCMFNKACPLKNATVIFQIDGILCTSASRTTTRTRYIENFYFIG